MPDNKRRKILKTGLGASLLGVGAASGLISPKAVFAEYPAQAFDADNVQAAIYDLYGHAQLLRTNAIDLRVPPIAENGAEVSILVMTDMQGVDSISIFANKNPTPLAASYDFTEYANPFVRTRIKLRRTSQITVVARVEDVLYVNQKEVKVTIAGCGG